MDIIDRINAMSDDDRRSALCWLSGYRPEALVTALDAIEEREAHKALALSPRTDHELFAAKVAEIMHDNEWEE